MLNPRLKPDFGLVPCRGPLAVLTSRSLQCVCGAVSLPAADCNTTLYPRDWSYRTGLVQSCEPEWSGTGRGVVERDRGVTADVHNPTPPRAPEHVTTSSSCFLSLFLHRRLQSSPGSSCFSLSDLPQSFLLELLKQFKGKFFCWLFL